MNVKCYWLEETELVQISLRRFRYSEEGASHYCDTGCAPFDVVRVKPKTIMPSFDGEAPPHSDRRWLTVCKTCGQPMREEDQWQVFQQRVYQRSDTGAQMLLSQATPGAMWDAWWMGEKWRGPDGLCLIVKVPPSGHEWAVDGPCSNCKRPHEKHHCWIRHGTPPHITVDKNGDTCSAGAGSILVPDWHGFLRNGELQPC